MNRQCLKLAYLIFTTLPADCLDSSETPSDGRTNSSAGKKEADEHPATIAGKYPVRWTDRLKLKSLDAIDAELAKPVGRNRSPAMLRMAT